jgi:hypothetical protein
VSQTTDRHARRVQVVTALHALGFNLLPIIRGEKRPPAEALRTVTDVHARGLKNQAVSVRAVPMAALPLVLKD